MTDEMIPMEEEMTEAGRTFTERVSVAGGDLIQTVQGLLREGAVRKITIQDKDGRTLVEIPLYAGVAGALILGSATVLALIAAWFAQVSILIERDKAADRGPTVVGEAVERAAGSAQSAASHMVGNVTAFLGTAGRGASDAAKRMADALETRLSGAAQAVDEAEGGVVGTADAAAMKVGDAADAVAGKTRAAADAAAAKVGEAAGAVAGKAHDAAGALSGKAHDAADALSDAVPARQCAATTKAGTRCKRPAMEGSDYCATHQIA